MCNPSFRVINEDISTHDNKDFIDFCDTLEEAVQCCLDNYFFNTSIEQWIMSDWKWKVVAINNVLISQ